jgi:hypothetical protein
MKKLEKAKNQPTNENHLPLNCDLAEGILSMEE